MSETTDYMNPYNDGYNIFNQFDRILFVPKHPLFQSELNELQSGQLTQQRWLADYSMNNGTILAGMGFQNEGYSAGDNVPADTNPNLFSTKNLISTQNYNGDTINDLIITTGDNYTDHGEIDITSDATDDGQPLYFTVSYNKPQSQYVTLSFDIAETGGTDDGKLENIGMELFNDTRITEATIDGEILKDGELTDDAGYNLTDTRNDNIDLSGGNWHEVVITMDVSKVGGDTNKFNLYFNAGFPSVSEGCNIKLDHFKIEQGTEPTTWELSDSDKSSVSGSDERNNKAFVSSGFVYLDGYVRRFNAQSIQIKGQGFEKIGLHLSHEVVTGNQDNKIDSNTQGTSTYGEAGASREHYNLTLSYGDEATNTPHDAVIYYLNNGKVIATASTSRSQALDDKLAQRTYETNGSFLATVRGLQMLTKPNSYDPSLINLQFTPGVAYVLGHRIQEDGSDILPIPIENETMQVSINRELSNSTDGTDRQFNLIPLDSSYPKLQFNGYGKDSNGDQYTGGIEITGKSQNLHQFELPISYNQPLNPITNGDTDQILFDKDTYIEVDGKKYPMIKQNADPSKPDSYNFYTADNNNSQVDDLDGNQILIPDTTDIRTASGQLLPTGQTVYVYGHTNETFVPYSRAYEYNITNVPSGDTQNTPQGVNQTPDYYIIKANNKYYISFNQCDKDLDITGAAHKNVHLSGNTPLVNNSGNQMTIKYFTYLARKDLITLDRNGKFYDIKGTPSQLGDVMPPINKTRGDNLTLDIGYVTVLPGEQVAKTQMATTPKVPFTNINDMRLELADLQYDMGVIAANQSTMNYVDPVTLVDIFSDFFTSTDKAAINDNLFNVLYNPAPYITPSYNAEGYLALTPQNLSFDQNTITMPMLENGNKGRNENVNYLNQDYQSNNTLTLNSFGLSNRFGTIVCDPEYINDKLTTEQISDPTDVEVMDSADATNYLQSEASQGSNFTPLYVNGGKSTLDDLVTPNGQVRDGQELQNKHTVTKGYSRAFIAPQFIHIQGSGFTPNSKNYSVYLPNEGSLHLPVMAKLPNNSMAVNHATPANGSQEEYDQVLPGIDNPRNYSQGVSYDDDKPGTVDADGNGVISCWFEIPKGRVRAMQQEVILANGSGELGTDEINATTYQPYKYTTTNDVVVNDYDMMNKDSEIASAGRASLAAEVSSDNSYLSSQVASLSTSTSSAILSLSDVESEDDSMFIDAVGSVDNSMNDITSAVQQDHSALNNLAEGVTDYMSYVDTNLSGLYSGEGALQSEADDLYSSADSFYYDHLETEAELGNLRQGVDSVAANEMYTADALNSAISVGNDNTMKEEAFDQNLSTSIANVQQQTEINTNNFNTFSQRQTTVDHDLHAETARTIRQLVHREITPYVDDPEAPLNDQGFNQWCYHWGLDPILIHVILHDSLLEADIPINGQTWDADTDFNLSQTQGGIWIRGQNVVPRNTPDTNSAIEQISEKLASMGMLNMHSKYAQIPWIPSKFTKKQLKELKKYMKEMKQDADTLNNRINRDDGGRD